MYYPEPFTKLGSFELKKLIIPLHKIIMFGMGTAMSLNDFMGVVKMPKGALVGIVAQFSIMPLIGFGLASAANLPPEIAAGVILAACSPSRLAPAVFGPWLNISGSFLATYWREENPEKTTKQT